MKKIVFTIISFFLIFENSYAFNMKDSNFIHESCKIFLDDTKATSSDENFGKAMFCLGWVKGAWDYAILKGAMDDGAKETDTEFAFQTSCIPLKSTPNQIVKIYVKHLDKYPEVLHMPPMFTLRKALEIAFPCKS